MTFKVYSVEDKSKDYDYRLCIDDDYGGAGFYISEDEITQLLAEILWAIRNKNNSSNRN